MCYSMCYSIGIGVTYKKEIDLIFQPTRLSEYSEMNQLTADLQLCRNSLSCQ